MIKVKFLVLKSGEIVGFKAKGHSGFEEIGKDIVCAAVSSAIFMTVNTITEILKVPIETEIDESKVNFFFRLEEKNVKICSNILNGLKLHFDLLEEMYPKNLKVNCVEVNIC